MKDGDNKCSVVLHMEDNSPSESSGKRFKEFKFKNTKKRRKSLNRPSDSVSQAYIRVTPGEFFGGTLFYTPKDPQEPKAVICEISIDGKKITYATIHSSEKGTPFKSLLNSNQLQKLRFPKVSTNTNESYSGTIQIIFWRVLQIDIDENDCEHVADEGLPALAIFCFHYRDFEHLSLQKDLNPNDIITSEMDSLTNPDASDCITIQDSQVEPEAIDIKIKRFRVPVCIFQDEKQKALMGNVSVDLGGKYDTISGSMQRLLQFWKFDDSLMNYNIILKNQNNQIIHPKSNDYIYETLGSIVISKF